MFLFSSASRVESLALTASAPKAETNVAMIALVILFIAAIWAGVQNALAGGGSFITLPSLMLTGMDARAANITPTVALFPAQLVTGFTGRADAGTPTGLTTRRLFVISLVGGALGALILLAMPPSIFVFSRDMHWPQALVTAVGASFGGWAGALMLRRVNEQLLKIAVVALGLALTIGLFWTAP
jgi:uncharacterized membrane protein YfcA